uniref:CMP/dCMP-type deaminase domain-containing protein n=1 Tax=Oncorhynchus mykiss TaxID=8022 RepID=A0A8K9V9G2_ONCMY
MCSVSCLFIMCLILCVLSLLSPYAMAVLLTQQQCSQNGAIFDVGVQPQVVQNTLNDNKVYTGNRLIAATPLKTSLYIDHAEYRLLSGDNNNFSPMQTLINNAGSNAGQCIVFFSTYSPCLEKCNNPKGRYNILQFMNVFQVFDNNRKAFVFSSVWDRSRNHPGVTNPDREWVVASFQRIESFLPLYRCDRFKENNKWVNRCYNCVTNPDDLYTVCMDTNSVHCLNVYFLSFPPSIP